MDSFDMMEKFPLMIPCNFGRVWKGYVSLNAEDIYMDISCPNFPKLDNLNINIPECNNFGSNQFDLKTSQLIEKKTLSLPDFLTELISDLNTFWKQDLYSKLETPKYTKLSTNFGSVIEEVNLCSEYVHEIDDNFKHITFNVLDSCEGNHYIKIYIPKEYPKIKKQPLQFETEVPSVAANSLLMINNILDLVEKFVGIVEELNDFWSIHREIINTCNTIGTSTLKDVNFKIPIDSHVIVEVKVDPFNARYCPKFDLYGQSGSIEKFQLQLNKTDPVLIWNFENSFKNNVLNVFDIKTLTILNEENELNYRTESPENDNCCFICYDQLDTVAKEKIKSCSNEKCDALYHMACICEWLLNSRSTPMFKHLQGKCPQCEEDILVELENF